MGAWRGNWKEGFFIEDSEGYIKKCSGNGHLFIGATLGMMEGDLYREFGDKHQILFYKDKIECRKL